MTLHGRQADVRIDRRRIIVVQTAKLRMNCEPRLGIFKKESQDFVRCPADQALARPDLPAVLVGESGSICLIA